MIEAVIFDVDGVLVESEQLAGAGSSPRTAGRWRDGATADMQGMSSVEWSRYMHDERSSRRCRS
jgi:phosphoglycolate phosphatase-like HAD superfamily hydrolase